MLSLGHWMSRADAQYGSAPRRIIQRDHHPGKHGGIAEEDRAGEGPKADPAALRRDGGQVHVCVGARRALVGWLALDEVVVDPESVEPSLLCSSGDRERMAPSIRLGDSGKAEVRHMDAGSYFHALQRGGRALAAEYHPCGAVVRNRPRLESAVVSVRQLESAATDLRRLSHDGLDSRTLQTRFLARLARLIPFDTAWFALCDPATLLFTAAIRQDMPQSSTPRFVEDEFLLDDFNKWTELTNAPVHAQSLSAATGGDLRASYRWREILEPLGLADELRVALVTGGICWGFICLHRATGTLQFAADEATSLDTLAAVMADGLRASSCSPGHPLRPSTRRGCSYSPPTSRSGMSPRAERWLAEISDDDWPSMRELPPVVLAVAGRLRSSAAGTRRSSRPAPALEHRTGVWLVVRASRLDGDAAAGQTAIVLAPAAPVEVAPLIMDAYALTQRERELTGLVLRGMSTKQLGAALRISQLTVQQHLKSIFDKTGVRSRRELAAQVFAAHYQPKLAAGRTIGSTGYFKG